MKLELQGKNKCIGEMMSTVSSYKSKFELLMTDLANNTFDHFPNTQDHLGQYPNFVFHNEKYVTEICSVIQEFENRFCDFQKIETVVDKSIRVDKSTCHTHSKQMWTLKKLQLLSVKITY